MLTVYSNLYEYIILIVLGDVFLHFYKILAMMP